MNKYYNYYNGENANFTFFFDGFTKEEAERVQAYMLQDSHFILDDENVLENIGKEKITQIRDKNFTLGTITISKDPQDKGHFIILGCSRTKDFQGDESGLIYRGDIYEGLNFIAIKGLVQDEQTHMCKFSEVNWCYEKTVDPTRLTRYNIKNTPLGANSDKWDLEGEDIVYRVKEGFRITDNPTKAFKESIKEVQVKKR